jgi:short-subunit dehydrogenase
VMAPGPVRIDLPAEKLIPDFLFVSPEYVAKVSLDGLARNKMRVVPGVTSKVMSAAAGYAPRSVVTPIVGAVYKKLGGD